MKLKKMKGGINKMNKLLLTIAILSLIALLGVGVFAQTNSIGRGTSSGISSSSGGGHGQGGGSNGGGSGGSTGPLVNGTISSSSSGGGHGQGGGGRDNYLKVELEPKKQFSKDGTAAYKVVVKDNHGNGKGIGFRYMKYQCYDGSEGKLGGETSCKPAELWREYIGDECEKHCSENSGKCGVNSFSIEEKCSVENGDSDDDRTYKYELGFDSKQDMEGLFEEETILLKAGETKTLALKVKAEKKGLHPFTVFVSGEDAKAKTRGLLIVDDDGTYPHPTNPYFQGEGFIVNYDNSKGRLISLNILKNGEKLNGRMKIRDRNLKLEGTIADGKVEFSLFSPKRNGKVANFNGKVEKFDNFLLLKGELSTIDGDAIQIWDLTAIGMQKPLFIEIDEAETKKGATAPTEVDTDSVVVIEDKATDEKTKELGRKEKYFRIKEVRKERFLGIFPKFWSNSKEAIIEMFDDSGKTAEKTVKAFGETKLEEYTISVGSLENKKIKVNIEAP